MPMMMSQILKSVDFTKAQISRYLNNGTLLFLQIKKIISYTSRASFVAVVTFNEQKPPPEVLGDRRWS